LFSDSEICNCVEKSLKTIHTIYDRKTFTIIQEMKR
jgi:hypothetical protein